MHPSQLIGVASILLTLGCSGPPDERSLQHDRTLQRVDDPTLHPAFDPTTAAPPPAKPSVPRNPERTIFFGDLHIHTSFSSDAFILGVRALPDDAYRFARGGAIEHAAGYAIQLSRPLDFAAVTDHSEYLGMIRARRPATPLTQRPLRDLLLNGSRREISQAWQDTVASVDFALAGEDRGVMRDAWQHIIDAAARHYTPGSFTTFNGYEWSSFAGGGHLHRNVIYRGTAVPELPYSSVDSDNPEDLWRALDEQRANGMDSIAIPHNPNLSRDQRTYASVDFNGEPLTAEYVELRTRNEPISEILQVKGSSETHPLLSSVDEFAGFEIYPDWRASEPGELRGRFARDALRTGLEMWHSDDFNPFDFGFIGSSDGHNASSPVEEDRHHGKLPMLDGSAALRLGEALLAPSLNPGGQWNGGGLAAVWAEENTRESLFDAMRRKETYATSGPRIVVRFYGGWSITEDMLTGPDPISHLQQNGVPMGGMLPALAGPGVPRFAVWALKDPRGANLDRIQIVKVGIDAAGRSYERIHDVAASDGRSVDLETGRLPPVGNTVDLETASYTNDIGAVQLSTVWRDRDFDPALPAVYYARVLEIPTPRWSTYDAVTLGVEPPEPATIEERAITSAIWFEPARDS